MYQRSRPTKDGSFSFKKKRLFRYENDDEKIKTKRSFLKRPFLNENRLKIR